MEGVKPEVVIEILKKHNVHISLEQAKVILDFKFKSEWIAFTQNGGT